MFDGMQYRYRSIRQRIRRIERREVRDLRRWLEDTENLLRLTALLILPIFIGAITLLSNVSPAVSFLVYPPLASGAYTLFADPGGRYSSPLKFVGGMTIGAFSGWVALESSALFWYTVPPDQFQVHAGAAALGIFLTGVLTWVFEFEQPTAFSSALLVLVTGSEQLIYVGGIAVSSLVVAGLFAVWRQRFYHERARYLFQSTQGDDQILVPIRETVSDSLLSFAARLAAAHESGKLVLVETIPPEVIKEAESEVIAEFAANTASEVDAEVAPSDVVSEAEQRVTEEALERLERVQVRIEQTADVPVEFVVAVEDGTVGETVLETAELENCDLIVGPYETDEDGELSRFVRTVLSGDTDAIVFRTSNGRTEWHRILVMVRSPGEVANAMLDFAHRLVTDSGTISACTCISHDRERRTAETMLGNVIETLPVPIETRIAHGSVEAFLERNASHYDLAVVGASTDRSAASRFLSTPTFERIRDLECGLAIVHRG